MKVTTFLRWLATLALLILVLEIMSCSPPVTVSVPSETPTPDIEVVVAQAIKGTMTAMAPTTTPVPTSTPIPTQALPTATPTNTLVPTSTPTPRPTWTPKPSPTATATPVIPEGWILYKDPTDGFVMHRPSKWPVASQFADENETGVSFNLPGFGFVLIGMGPKDFTLEVGNEESLNRWVKEIMSRLDSRDSIRIVSKGTWSTPSALFVESLATHVIYDGYETVWHQVNAYMPLEQSGFVCGIARIGTLTASELADFELMLATIQVR